MRGDERVIARLATGGIGTALTMLLGVGAQTATPSQAPDRIYYHGNVRTMDDRLGTVSAFAVAGDRIVAVGSDAAIRKLASRATALIDLKGATVIPGLSDSHDHLWNSGKFLHRGVNMVGVDTAAEFERRLRTAVRVALPGEVVYTTTGWDIRPAPTRASLDALSRTVPIAAISYRRGLAIFNTAALDRVGVSRMNPIFRGVKVPVDAVGEPLGTMPGFPTGLYMIEALLPPLTQQQRDCFVSAEMRRRNAFGITAIRDLAIWPDAYKGLQGARSDSVFSVRVAVGLEFPDEDRALESVMRLPPPNRDDPWLFLDAIGEEPWTPGVMSPRDFTRIVLEMRKRGWRPAPHVSSDVARGIEPDVAADNTLGAYEAVERAFGIRGRRWYVEHIPYATRAEIDRLAKIGAVVSVQDAGYRLPSKPPYGPDRMRHINPVRTLLDKGVLVIGGSDYAGPTPENPEAGNPFRTMQFLVERRDANGRLAADERISPYEALRLFTVNAAQAVFQERRRGRVAPGLLADFAILDRDPLRVAVSELGETKVKATFVGGRQVFPWTGADKCVLASAGVQK